MESFFAPLELYYCRYLEALLPKAARQDLQFGRVSSPAEPAAFGTMVTNRHDKK